MTRWMALALAVCVALGLALGLRLTDGTAAAGNSPWGVDYFPNVPVVTHEGKELRFYDDLIKGKIVVINFIYTSCTSICSLSTARLAEVREKLGDRVGRDIFFYSITLDPVVDGPEVLKKFASHFYSGPGWLFLTGKPEDIDLIRYKLGERSRSKSQHRNDIMLGNDVTGEWGRDSIFSDIDHQVQVIREMDPAWRAQVHTVDNSNTSGKARAFGGAPPGQALFLKACSSCHTIGQGILVGPDLAGVTARRDLSWLQRFVAAPDKMLAEKDPTALELASKFNGFRMPNLGLSEADAKDVIDYVEAQSRSVELNAPVPKSAADESQAPVQSPR